MIFSVLSLTTYHHYLSSHFFSQSNQHNEELKILREVVFNIHSQLTNQPPSHDQPSSSHQYEMVNDEMKLKSSQSQSCYNMKSITGWDSEMVDHEMRW